MNRFFLVLLISVVFPICSWGQSSYEKVEQLFAQNEPVKWVRYYRGRVNDMNEVVLTLGSNGLQYKGVLQYMRSKATFIVEGLVDEDKLKLVEKDTLGIFSGQIEATIKDFEGIEGNWYNHDKSVGNQIRLIPYAQEPRYPTYCGDNKWIKSFQGMINGETVELIVKRGNNGQIAGNIYFGDKAVSHEVLGEITDYERLINLNISDVNYTNVGALELNYDYNTNALNGTIQKGEQKDSCYLFFKQQLSVGCIEFANYHSIMEVTYPKTTSLNFNEFIKNKVDAWVSSARTYTGDYEKQMTSLSARHRASLRAYFWYDIQYLSDEIISGKANYTNSWDLEYGGFVYNYNLKTGEEILMSDIFNTASGYEQFVQSYIMEDMKNRPYYSDPTFQTWLSSAQFKYYTIRKDGLLFSTDFHGIFGEQQCLIPYKELSPYMKLENPTRNL